MTTPFGSPVVPDVYSKCHRLLRPDRPPSLLEELRLGPSCVGAGRLQPVHGHRGAEDCGVHTGLRGVERGVVDDHESAQCRHLIEQGLPSGQLACTLDHDDRRGTVLGQVAQLVGAERGVGRARHRAEMRRGEVDQPVLEPAGHRNQHSVTGRQAQRGQTGDRSATRSRSWPPGQRLVAHRTC